VTAGPRRVLVTGADGQLGRAVTASVPPGTELKALPRRELDIADAPAVAALLGEFAPELLINAAAFTRVDDAEREPQAAARANVEGPEILAAACRRGGVWLTHVSTDYVFDGTQNHPYAPDSPPKPLGVYGRTKLEGERRVRAVLSEGSTVVRASWLYSAAGGFAGRMLTLMKSRPQLSIVADQVGAPTSCAGLAQTLWELSARRATGIWHWCDSGIASWYDFAVAVAELGSELGILSAAPAITPIAAADYPTLAARPRYSVLDKRATEKLLERSAPHWRQALRDTLRGAS
jgi:dTDP-4-dehydrorhamnose reductase